MSRGTRERCGAFRCQCKNDLRTCIIALLPAGISVTEFLMRHRFNCGELSENATMFGYTGRQIFVQEPPFSIDLFPLVIGRLNFAKLPTVKKRKGGERAKSIGGSREFRCEPWERTDIAGSNNFVEPPFRFAPLISFSTVSVLRCIITAIRNIDISQPVRAVDPRG